MIALCKTVLQLMLGAEIYNEAAVLKAYNEVLDANIFNNVSHAKVCNM